MEEIHLYLCEECGKSFPSKRCLEHHLRNQHVVHNHPQDKLSSVSIEENHLCEECGKPFPSKQCLERHLKKEHVEFFECKFCHQKFEVKTHLTKHLRVHNNPQRKFQCKICGKYFSRKWLSENHHYKEDVNLQCEICDKKFCNKYSLDRHLKVHMNYGILKCNSCDKNFTREDNLLRHIKKYHN